MPRSKKNSGPKSVAADARISLLDAKWRPIIAFDPKIDSTLRKQLCRVAGFVDGGDIGRVTDLRRSDADAWVVPLAKALKSSDAVRSKAMLIPVGATDGTDEAVALAQLDVGLPLDPESSVKHRQMVMRQNILKLRRNAELDQLRQTADLQERTLNELHSIGAALSAETDQEVLLQMIVSKVREIIGADAGSLYLLADEMDEGSGDVTRWLHFRVAQNDTLKGEFKAFKMPLNRQSIAGYCALSGKVQQLPDVYELPEDWPYSFNTSFDQATGYRSKSMLVVPMRNHDNEVIGVIQLINKKKNFKTLLKSQRAIDNEILPFSDADRLLLESLASQAALSIENAMLVADIRNLLTSFMQASVKAVESRDPTTSGHSERVAQFTVALAERVDNVSSGKLKQFQFSREQLEEIYFAGILHDFGKIGVREHVLVKAKKLYPFQMSEIRWRYRYIDKAMRLQMAQEQIALMTQHGVDGAQKHVAKMQKRYNAELQRLAHFTRVIEEANEPSVLPAEAASELDEIAAQSFQDGDVNIPLLLDDELLNLKIGKGSLNDDERSEIESHVSHTYSFLQMIPWTKDLQSVPDIAFGHHEKLDGSGYPRKLTAPDLPVQTRMMTISDIFDALTASDRPYKRAMSAERALFILDMEVKEGKLDKDLVDVFREAKVYEVVMGEGAA